MRLLVLAITLILSACSPSSQRQTFESKISELVKQSQKQAEKCATIEKEFQSIIKDHRTDEGDDQAISNFKAIDATLKLLKDYPGSSLEALEVQKLIQTEFLQGSDWDLTEAYSVDRCKPFVFYEMGKNLINSAATIKKLSKTGYLSIRQEILKKIELELSRAPSLMTFLICNDLMNRLAAARLIVVKEADKAEMRAIDHEAIIARRDISILGKKADDRRRSVLGWLGGWKRLFNEMTVLEMAESERLGARLLKVLQNIKSLA